MISASDHIAPIHPSAWISACEIGAKTNCPNDPPALMMPAALPRLSSVRWRAAAPTSTEKLPAPEPTAAIVGKLFGIRYLATLFGLTLLSHQIGGFFGAYLGGIALAQSGNYQWMWYADIALAAAAAVVNLPIREARIVAPVSVAA